MTSNVFFTLCASLVVLAGTCLLGIPRPDSSPQPNRIELMHAPSDYFFLQRTYPDSTFATKAYTDALKEARRGASALKTGEGFDVEWTLQGPGNIGGRMNTVAVHPSDSLTIYAGTTASGVYKTTDGGNTWNPIFDDQPFLSIGHIHIDPSNPNTVYVGTGDPNISGYPSIGDGVYKSIDGGQNWTHLGLVDQRIVSRIAVDPNNSNTLYVATMGLPFERNNDRGLYKSTDGGQSWNQILFVSDQAGIIDLVMDPFNANTLYAASWDRIRNNKESTAHGANGKVWKSIDGGTNWSALGGGLPTDSVSRIGLWHSSLNQNTLFAMYVGKNQQLLNIFKTTDGGTTWIPIPTFSLSANALGGFGWYFGQIRTSPTSDNEIYLAGVELHGTLDGGLTWNRVTPAWWQYEVHADIHDLQFIGPNNMLLATDGGLYQSPDRGQNWTDIENIPNTQLYRVAYNPHKPDFYYGGAQDNGSMGGNLANFNNYERIFGGDGFQMAFDSNDPNTWYCETQNGNLVYTDDSGLNYFSHTVGLDSTDRRNWDMPFMISAHDPDRQYIGTQRVYRNVDGPGGIWQRISPDITDGLISHRRFHTITTVNESAIDQDIVYAGTTDGNVWVTTDGGGNWMDITTGLPNRFVTSVKPSPSDVASAFACHSGYRDNDFIPHIHKTMDYGQTWVDISGDLPQLAVNDVLIYPGDDSILFVATDGGVYGTTNGGAQWHRIGINMPIFPVYDMVFNEARNELVAGTFARSIMTYPMDSILVHLNTTTGIFQGFQNENLTFYPNPVKDWMQIEMPENIRSLDLVFLDISGKTVKTVSVSSNERIDLQGLPTGQYLIRASHEGRVLSGKMSKQ
ncbi:T9SS type A sorting domain-containing protein [bacterium]|nr:T9SS type A sorting domain-containing protein [bacterium]